MGDIGSFLYAVLDNWVALMSGGIITVVLALWERHKKNTITFRRYFWLMVLFVFIACFLAWRDSRKEASQLQDQLAVAKQELQLTKQELLQERDHNTPKLQGLVNLIVKAESERQGGAQLLILITVRNLGSPSVVEGWQLRVRSGELDKTFRPEAPPADDMVFQGEGIEPAKIPKEEMLFEKAVKPIQRGDQLRGWLWFSLKGIPKSQIDAPEARLTLYYYDVASKRYELEIEGPVTDNPPVFPGTTQPFRRPPLPETTPQR